MTNVPPPPPPPRGTAPRQAAKVTAPTIGRPKKGIWQAPKLILNAVEGWGKTSAGAFAEKPLILMARGEAGYTTLLGANRVPECDTIVDENGLPKTLDSWPETMAILDSLVAMETLPFNTLVLDALGGFERLCHEYVCETSFDGKWEAFVSYYKGFVQSVSEWLLMLQKLEQIQQKGATILLLSHCQVRTFKNPAGDDFDHYASSLDARTWGAVAKWADGIFLGKFLTDAKKAKGDLKAKGIGGKDRVIYTEHSDAVLAKNRFGMKPTIKIPNDHTKAWETIANAMKGNK